MALSGGALATAYVEIRPDVSQFQSTVERSVRASTGTGISVPAKVDEAGLGSQAKTVFGDLGQKAGGFFSDNFKTILKTAGLFVGVAEAVNIVREGVAGAAGEALSTSRLQTLLGPAAEAITQAAEHANQAAGASTAAFLGSATQVSQVLSNIGFDPTRTAGFTNQITTLAGQLAALNPALGDTASVTEAVDRAMQTGTARGLLPFGIHITDAEIKAQALSSGLATTTANTDKLTAAQFKVNDAHQRVNVVTTALTASQAKYTEAVAKHGQSSPQALSAAAALAGKQDELRKANEAVTTSQDALQTEADKVTVTLTDQAKAQAVLQLILKDAPGIQDQFTAAQQSGALANTNLSNAIDDAKDALGTGLLPVIQQFSSWVSDHQGAIQGIATTIGTDLAGAFTTIKNVGQWFVDHPEVPAIIGTLFVASKVRDWTQAVDGIPGLLNSVIRRMLGLPGVGTAAGGAGGITATTEFQAAVTEFQVAVTEFAGAAGLGGRGLPTGEPVPTPEAPIATAGKVAGVLGPLLYRSPVLAPLALGTLLSGDKPAGGPSNLPDLTNLDKELRSMTPTQLAAAWRDSTSQAFKDLELGLKGPDGLALIDRVHTDIQALPAAQQGPIRDAFEAALKTAQQSGTALGTAIAQPKTFGPGFSADPGQTVRSQYAQVLNRDPEQAGYDFWTTYLKSHGQQDFESAFLGAARGNEAALVRPSPFSRPYGAVTVPPELTGPLATIVTYLQTIANKPANATTIINQPTSDVDALLALRRADYHNQVTVNRNVYPATSWPADLTLRPGAPS